MVKTDDGKTIKDSGERTEYSTGAVRDLKEGKGRFDLMPLDVVENLDHEGITQYIQSFKESGKVAFLYNAIEKFSSHFSNGKTVNDVLDGNLAETMLEVAKHFEQGAKKYGENNWQKGIPVHSYIDSAIRHYMKYKAGWVDEPHDRAFIWNLMCCIWTMENMPELDDFTVNKKTKEEIKMTYYEAQNEAGMLQGNVCVMLVSDDPEDVEKMYESAKIRLKKIYEYNYNRVRLAKMEEN